jgi:hypothetical protein
MTRGGRRSLHRFFVFFSVPLDDFAPAPCPTRSLAEWRYQLFLRRLGCFQRCRAKVRALSLLVGKPSARETHARPVYTVDYHYWPAGQQLHEIAFFEFCLKHLGGSRRRNLRTFLGGSDSLLQKMLKNLACLGPDARKTSKFLVRVLCEVFNAQYAMASKGVNCATVEPQFPEITLRRKFLPVRRYARHERLLNLNYL